MKGGVARLFYSAAVCIALGACSAEVRVAVPAEIAEMGLGDDFRAAAREAGVRLKLYEIPLNGPAAEEIPLDTWWFAPADLKPDGARSVVVDRTESFAELGTILAALRIDSPASGMVCVADIRSGDRRAQEIQALISELEAVSELVVERTYSIPVQINRVVDELHATGTCLATVVMVGSATPSVLLRLGADGFDNGIIAAEFLSQRSADEFALLTDLRFAIVLDLADFLVRSARVDIDSDTSAIHVRGRISRY